MQQRLESGKVWIWVTVLRLFAVGSLETCWSPLLSHFKHCSPAPLFLEEWCLKPLLGVCITLCVNLWCKLRNCVSQCYNTSIQHQGASWPLTSGVFMYTSVYIRREEVGGILDVVLYVIGLAVHHKKAGFVNRWYTTLLLLMFIV